MAFIPLWAFTANFLVGFKQTNIICTYNVACHSCCQVVIRAIASAELKLLSCKYIIHYLILYIDIKVPIYSILINILLTCCFTSAGFSSFSSLHLLPLQRRSGQTKLYQATTRKKFEWKHQYSCLSQVINSYKESVNLCERIRIYESRLLTCKKSHISSSA